MTAATIYQLHNPQRQPTNRGSLNGNVSIVLAITLAIASASMLVLYFCNVSVELIAYSLGREREY